MPADRMSDNRMLTANEAECLRAGVDSRAVESIIRRLLAAARDANRLGLTVFGGAGSLSLRWYGDGGGPLIVAEGQAQNVDGGDGASRQDEEGLFRGE